jgi:MFS family permease
VPAADDTDVDARRERWSVVFLLASVFLGAAGTLAQATVLGKQVYDLTGRELDLGLLGLAEFAPAALLVLVTGTVADRYDRRKVTALAFVGQAAVAGGLAWYASTSPTRVWPIFALVLGSGITSAFAAPASRSLPADTVRGERLPWLIARFSGAWQASIVVGPVLGGFLYDRDVVLPYLATAVLLGLSAGAVLLVRVRPLAPAPVVPTPLEEAALDPAVGRGTVPEAAPGAGLRDALEGLRFIRHHPVLLGAISLDLFAVLFGGAVALLPAIATDRLGVDAVGLGWLRAAGGVGAALVTLALAIRPVRRHIGRRLLAVVALFGVATLFLGITHSFVVALVAMAVLSGADAVSVFIRATLVPLVTPADKRGRVLAVENVFIGASNELGAFESGVAGQLLGPAGAIVLGGVGTLAVAGGWWFLFPGLRDVDEFPASAD